ncbi:PCTP-like protein [Eufriesea mexicana]|nr:PCTP-like protein [Eufriesea mexicana]
MDIGIVKIAEDKDFEKLKHLYDDNNDWRLDYNKPDLSVWTKSVSGISFRMIRTRFPDVLPEILYDVLHDPEYRKVWDTHMIESKDIVACPSPLKNRDFVLQRSWLDTGIEQLILNHSVFHKDYPPRKQFVRATSYLTGYIVRPSRNGDGSELGYVSHTDPHGKLPVWLVNKVTQIFAPRMVKKLHKASIAYPNWKLLNNPNYKPWHFPEQITSPLACPSPLKNRDFVLQRSWLDTGIEQLILNHSVFHKDYPPRKQFVRATSYLTGYIVRPSRNGDGSELGYVSHTDPHGKLPVWLVNKVTQIFAPRMVKKLHKASIAYPNWKLLNNPNYKPWHFPEQITSPRIKIGDCVKSVEEKNSKNNYVDESELKESITMDSD